MPSIPIIVKSSSRSQTLSRRSALCGCKSSFVSNKYLRGTIIMSGLTITDPVKLSAALVSPNVIPGDVLYLRSGTYAGDFTINIGGSSEASVTIKPYNNEPVIIDGGLMFAKPYVRIQDVEITNSNPDRTLWIDPGIQMHQVGCELIGCYIHDLHNNGVTWQGNGTGQIVECLIYNNGSNDGTSYGHGIYTHNDTGGARKIARNLFLNSIGRYSIHIYSAGNNYLRDYTVEDNVIFGDPVICGGGLGLRDYVYQGNIQSGDYCYQGRYSSQPNDGGLIQNNLFIDLSEYSVQDGFLNLTETGNTVWGGEPASRAGYTVAAKPANWSQFIPFTLSERWAGIQCSIVDSVFSAEIV